jgi:hypothetical protein
VLVVVYICIIMLILTVFLMLVDPCITVQFIQNNPTRCNRVSKFIIPYLYEAQHVSGDTPPIIRSLKLHIRERLLDVWFLDAVRQSLTASSNHTSNNLSRTQNQRLPVQF